ncbi:MAG: sensor histidine kinase [Minwuia sp.]|uniref:sensor histidine kinase n=1 Tax=Minwuia sp. TaxID=2493630 RepID=UPI003A861ED5
MSYRKSGTRGRQGPGARSLFSGEFRDPALEVRYRETSADAYRRQVQQLGVLILLVSGPLLLADYFRVRHVDDIEIITALRGLSNILPALWIFATSRKFRYPVIDALVFAYIVYMIADAVVMIRVFGDDVVPMAARLPLYVIIANVMLALPIRYRLAMNVTAFPAFAGAFWLLAPLPPDTAMTLTLILVIAFLFGFMAGTWMANLRRSDFYRSEELLAANAALVRSYEEVQRANSAKSAFLSNVSHELRTPLNAIIGFSDVLGRQMFGPVGNPRYREYVGDIQTSGQQLLALINDLLDLNKLEAGKMEMQPAWIGLRTAIADCVRQVRSANSLDETAIAVGAVDDIEVYADPGALRQIMVNLLSNALKYGGSGGPVGFSAELSAPGRGLRICIADSGPGIPQDQIDKLLRPFEQADSGVARKAEGWGLGLPLADALARANQSELRIDSAPGKGTRASLLVPRQRVRRAAGQSGEAA